MKPTKSTKNRKDLNKLTSNIFYTTRGASMKKEVNSKLKGDELVKAIKEAQKDPEFMKDIDKFIEATTKKVFKLKDLGF